MRWRWIWAAALLALSACRTGTPASGPTAECPVCAFEGDLACLCVRIGVETPHLVHAGRELYFCSEECRAEFRAHASRYVER